MSYFSLLDYSFDVFVDPKKFIKKLFRGGHLNGFYMAPIQLHHSNPSTDGFEVAKVKVDGHYYFSEPFTYQHYVRLILEEIKKPSAKSLFPAEILNHMIQSDPVLCKKWKRMGEKMKSNDYFEFLELRDSFTNLAVEQIVRRFGPVLPELDITA